MALTSIFSTLFADVETKSEVTSFLNTFTSPFTEIPAPIPLPATEPLIAFCVVEDSELIFIFPPVISLLVIYEYSL